MKSDKKHNKKQIDAEINRMLLSDFDKIENFVVSRWKQMFIGAGIIIVIVAIAYGIVLKKDNNAFAARSAIANATGKQQLIEVIDRYSSYREADFARIKLAKIYAEEKDYAKAIELYKTVAGNNPDQDLKCQMMLDEAYMQEKSGAFENAVKSFVIIGDNTMFAAGIRAEAYYGAMRLSHKLKKTADADKIFAKLNLLAGDEVADTWINFAKALQSK